MRLHTYLLLLLLALGLTVLGCTPRGGRGGGGGGGGDDDDSAGDDDDDDDDDDDGAGDDDDSTGGGNPVVPSNAGGTYTLEFDFSSQVTADFGWEDCQRLVTLTQVSGDIENGCPSCDYVMRFDSSSVSTNCNAETGITDDPMTGIQFGVRVGDGDLRFWNYGDEMWDTFLEGGNGTNSAYSGDSGWEAFDFENEGTTYDYESRVQVNITWN